MARMLIVKISIADSSFSVQMLQGVERNIIPAVGSIDIYNFRASLFWIQIHKFR